MHSQLYTIQTTYIYHLAIHFKLLMQGCMKWSVEYFIVKIPSQTCEHIQILSKVIIVSQNIESVSQHIHVAQIIRYSQYHTTHSTSSSIYKYTEHNRVQTKTITTPTYTPFFIWLLCELIFEKGRFPILIKHLHVHLVTSNFTIQYSKSMKFFI